MMVPVALAAAASPAPISEIVSDVGSIVTAAAGWIGQFTTVITSNPLIEMFVITSFVGLAVGLIRRLIRL